MNGVWTSQSNTRTQLVDRIPASDSEIPIPPSSIPYYSNLETDSDAEGSISGGEDESLESDELLESESEDEYICQCDIDNCRNNLQLIQAGSTNNQVEIFKGGVQYNQLVENYRENQRDTITEVAAEPGEAELSELRPMETSDAFHKSNVYVREEISIEGGSGVK